MTNFSEIRTTITTIITDNSTIILSNNPRNNAVFFLQIPKQKKTTMTRDEAYSEYNTFVSRKASIFIIRAKENCLISRTHSLIIKTKPKKKRQLSNRELESAAISL